MATNLDAPSEAHWRRRRWHWHQLVGFLYLNCARAIRGARITARAYASATCGVNGVGAAAAVRPIRRRARANLQDQARKLPQDCSQSGGGGVISIRRWRYLSSSSSRRRPLNLPRSLP